MNNSIATIFEQLYKELQEAKMSKAKKRRKRKKAESEKNNMTKSVKTRNVFGASRSSGISGQGTHTDKTKYNRKEKHKY